MPRNLQPVTRIIVRLALITTSASAVIRFSGCSAADFVGAYFNTYYNAQRLFREAEDEVLSQQTATRPDKVFLPPFNASQGAKTKFNSVIEKCSKLLQYHPQSELVDDALFMIGRSYYYLNEHQKAERKFTELIEGYPQSDLVMQARLLMAYTYYRAANKDKAFDAAIQLVQSAVDEEDDDVLVGGAMLLGQIEADRGNFREAAVHYQTAAEHSGSAAQRNEAYMKLAETHYGTGDFEKALESYRHAQEESPDNVREVRARLGSARALSHLGRYDESLADLEEMHLDPGFKDFLAEINLEIGNVYNERGDFVQAAEQFRYVDTTFARTEVAARSYFALGLVYETKLFQYDSARAAFTKGKAEFPQAAVTKMLAHRSEYLSKYFLYLSEIVKYDSIRFLILHPPDTSAIVPDTAATDTLLLPSSPPDTSALARRDSSATDTLLAGLPGKDSIAVKPPRVPSLPLDTVEARLAYNITEMAGLLYTTMGVPDSAVKWYGRLLSDHPNSRFVPRALFTLAQIYGQDTARSGTADSLYREVTTRFPESEFAHEAQRLLGLPVARVAAQEADLLYERGEESLNSGKTDLTVEIFEDIVRKYPDSPIASKAQYALGWIYEQVSMNPDSAISNYRRLVAQYPTSEYALIVKPKLAAVDAGPGGATPDSAGTKTLPPETGEQKIPEDAGDDGKKHGQEMQGAEEEKRSRLPPPEEEPEEPPEEPDEEPEPK